MLTLSLILIGSAVAEPEGSGVPQLWLDAVSELRLDEYAVRERAAATLSELPHDALPWIKEQLDQAASDDDPEFRRRLAGVVKAMAERKAKEELETGIQLSIDLDEATPEDILKRLNGDAPRRLIGDNIQNIWDDPDPVPFAFEGSYWELVDQLFETFPPKAAKDPGREQINGDLSIVRFDQADLAGVRQPRASAGVLHVRAAQTALEHSNGKDYFSITLVPKVEPAYLPDEVSLLLKGVHLAGGETLVPEGRVRSFERPSYRSEASYQPGRTFTWAIPLDEEIDRSGPVRVEALMQVKLRRMNWEQRKLPPLNGTVSFEGDITLTVEEQAKEMIKIKFEGAEGTRIDFNQYSRSGHSRLFDLLDAEGKSVEFRVQGSSSGGGGDSWHQSFNCRIEEGEVASVRALLPGERMTTRMPFEIEGVALPGMSH